MRRSKQNWSWIGFILTSILLFFIVDPAFSASSQIDDREQGLRLLNLKRYPAAEKRFSKALKANPSDPHGYHFRGMARLYQNDLEGATKDFKQALKLNPADAGIMASLGKAYFQSGQTSKAINILDNAVKTDPENHKAVNQLAWVLAVSPQKEFRNGTRAVMLAKRLNAKAENVHTLDTLAAAYAANKEYKKAVSTQEKALAILMKRSRTSDIDPYMERLKTYQKNRSWQYQKPDTKILAKTENTPSTSNKAKRDQPEVKKPAAKTPEQKKTVAPPQPKEKTVVTKSQTVDPKDTKPPATDKTVVKKPVLTKPAAKTPEVKKTDATPQPKEKTVVAKTQTVDPKDTKPPATDKTVVKKSVFTKPAAKAPEQKKTDATPQPKEITVVAKTQTVDQKDTKVSETDKPAAKKPAAKKPETEKPGVNLPSAEKTTATKTETGTSKEPLVTKKRPSSLLAKKQPKKNTYKEKESPPFYPYTIQIASFQDSQRAFFIANHLRKKGDPAFTGPITLETSGNWHRVLLGWHTSVDSAQKQLDILKDRQFREPAVVRRPYAVLIESSKNMNRLERIERRLKEMGQVPYRLSDRNKKGYWRMLVGAYSEPSMPADFAEALRQNGFQPVMVER